MSLSQLSRVLHRWGSIIALLPITIIIVSGYSSATEKRSGLHSTADSGGVCGGCGLRMTLCYHMRKGHLTPTYVCQREGIEHFRPICQSIPGHVVDEAISQLALSAMKRKATEYASGAKGLSLADRPTSVGDRTSR